ncbi:E1 [Equus caballus papillomavirus 9]|uniref:Replication protein E1 n=1 Tax=Equus caballus papillomavirus 9 TaxID=2601244 RepID=A0A5B8K9Z7_9PAPI|nr:E1 [Equus caballus papillomavirus 9]UXP87513.1 E1 protein [Equus caballus papillomavirus 9]UXP87520.1 E1 protein [Equus caballus papillomavirus 9]
MDADPGTSPGEGCSGACFILREAQCSDPDSGDDEGDTPDSPGAYDFVDNAFVKQGNSLSLYQQQENAEAVLRLQQLKRKLLGASPKEKGHNLNEVLPELSISPISPQVKRRLFEPPADNLRGSCSYEANSVYIRTSTQVGGVEGERPALREIQNGQTPIRPPVLDVLQAGNRQAAMLARFKEAFEVSYTELTRDFKSNKTCTGDWVALVYSVREAHYESAKELLQQHCDYLQTTYRPHPRGAICLMLLCFKHHKNRDTVARLLQSMLNVNCLHIMLQPPRTRSVPVALFFYKTGLGNTTTVFGKPPEWMARQTLLQHQTEDAMKFDMSQMVQWAYDNNYMDESTIAYQYALMADVDRNAAAFLSCTAQAKYVRDVSTMVKHYKRAEMHSMSMSNWIHKQCNSAEGEGDWRVIIKFLKYQNVEIPRFVTSLKHFLKGVPKKSCLAIFGEPDTGKSTFCYSLINFLKGKVLSFACSRSHFWLSPLADCRVALVDDATGPVWEYFDLYLRNALDGNPIFVDLKHRAPLQLRCPPILVTSNIDVRRQDKYRYLYSRMACFTFDNPYPLDENGEPVFPLTVEHWASFFTRWWKRLDLSEPEDEGEDGEATESFRCCSRRADASL